MKLVQNQSEEPYREGKKVMQFLSDRRYIANVVGGKVQVYGRSGRGE
jgi:hypothetical protein